MRIEGKIGVEKSENGQEERVGVYRRLKHGKHEAGRTLAGVNFRFFRARFRIVFPLKIVTFATKNKSR